MLSCPACESPFITGPSLYRLKCQECGEAFAWEEPCQAVALSPKFIDETDFLIYYAWEGLCEYADRPSVRRHEIGVQYMHSDYVLKSQWTVEALFRVRKRLPGPPVVPAPEFLYDVAVKGPVWYFHKSDGGEDIFPCQLWGLSTFWREPGGTDHVQLGMDAYTPPVFCFLYAAKDRRGWTFHRSWPTKDAQGRYQSSRFVLPYHPEIARWDPPTDAEVVRLDLPHNWDLLPARRKFQTVLSENRPFVAVG